MRNKETRQENTRNHIHIHILSPTVKNDGRILAITHHVYLKKNTDDTRARVRSHGSL